jgi:ketosteroid isomerase-like protein
LQDALTLRGDLVTTEKNKSIVRRLWRDVIVDGNLDILEDVVAPDFQNLDGLGNDVDRLKTAITAAREETADQRFDELDMVSEGDIVFARVNYVVTSREGTTETHRSLLYHRIVDGRIVAIDMARAG